MLLALSSKFPQYLIKLWMFKGFSSPKLWTLTIFHENHGQVCHSNTPLFVPVLVFVFHCSKAVGWVVYLSWRSQKLNRDYGGVFLTDSLSMVCLECFLTQVGITCPGMTPPTVNWALSCQSLIKKMPDKFSFRPTFWRQFLSWGVLF